MMIKRRSSAIYLLLLGYLSVLLSLTSAHFYFFMDLKLLTADQGLEITPANFRALQLPSMFGHPLFAVPALLLGHNVVRPGSEAYPAVKILAMAGCAFVVVLYARSLLPGIGLGYPVALIDLMRAGMWGLGLRVLSNW